MVIKKRSEKLEIRREILNRGRKLKLKEKERMEMLKKTKGLDRKVDVG